MQLEKDVIEVLIRRNVSLYAVQGEFEKGRRNGFPTCSLGWGPAVGLLMGHQPRLWCVCEEWSV